MIAKDGSDSGYYVRVGEDLGDGYELARIETFSVVLEGGAIPNVTLQLDTSVVGASGNARLNQPQQRLESSRGKSSGEQRWDPPAGMSREEIIQEVLRREGVLLKDVERDKSLENSLREKYKYLEDRVRD